VTRPSQESKTQLLKRLPTYYTLSCSQMMVHAHKIYIQSNKSKQSTSAGRKIKKGSLK
jgi:hypothetical protein